MSAVRTLVRGGRRYYYLVQTYRWGGEVRRKERYLGTTPPINLEKERDSLEREVWQATWLRSFDEIRVAYQARLQSIPLSVREQERDDFIVDFTYDTNRIEGSTLTHEETSALLTRGISPPSRPMRDIREAQLHADVVRRLLAKPEPLDLPHLLSWHRSIFGDTKSDIAGRVRDFEVRIRGSQHVPPSSLEVRPMLVELLRRTNRQAKAIHPVELAATFHFQFEQIHPFGDGNGRVGRLAMNLLLFQAGYPMLNIRYGRRGGYYRALEKSSLTLMPRPFVLWFFHRYRRDQSVWLRLTPGKSRGRKT
jgi:Fic family protein